MSYSVRPHRRQPTRLPVPGILQARILEWAANFLLQSVKVKSESEVAQSCPTLATAWTAAYQAPPSMGFSRQEYWSGVPLPSPGLFTAVGTKYIFAKSRRENHLRRLTMKLPQLWSLSHVIMDKWIFLILDQPTACFCQ